MINYDLVDPAELTGYARTVPRGPFALATFLPPAEVPDIEYRFRRGNITDVDAATFRTWDTPAPIAKRPGAVRVSGELPPISRKVPLTEEGILQLNALRAGADTELIEQIYGDAANMVRSVEARIELARGEALYSGQIVINENGLVATVDFGRNVAHSVAPGTLWSNPASTILSDLLTWRAVYVDTNGTEPGSIITSDAVIANMLRNSEIRALAATLVGTPSLVSRTSLAAVLTTHGLPPIFEYNTKVRVNGVATRVIPADRLIFMPPSSEPLGATFWGITAEALRLARSGRIELTRAPGIVAVVEDTDDPVRTWTKAAGVSIPVLANPDLTLAADVQ